MRELCKCKMGHAAEESKKKKGRKGRGQKKKQPGGVEGGALR